MLVLERLFDDQRLARAESIAAAVAAHLRDRRRDHAGMLGPLVVADRQLGEVARHLPDESPLAVRVINTGGAGGLLSLADRRVDRLRVVAVESRLRDLDDLAASAARVAAAARALDPAISVFVGLPAAPGWERAVEVVEGAGLHGQLVAGPGRGDEQPSVGLARQLAALVEADLPFSVTETTGFPIDAAGLVGAVAALVDGAAPEEAAGMLAGQGAGRGWDALVGWDAAAARRVRRRLQSIGQLDVAATLAHIARLFSS